MDDKKTLRDEIAIAVISEIVVEQGQLQYNYDGCRNVLRENCRLAYLIADCMMEIRKEEIKLNK